MAIPNLGRLMTMPLPDHWHGPHFSCPRQALQAGSTLGGTSTPSGRSRPRTATPPLRWTPRMAALTPRAWVGRPAQIRCKHQGWRIGCHMQGGTLEGTAVAGTIQLNICRLCVGKRANCSGMALNALPLTDFPFPPEDPGVQAMKRPLQRP